MKKFIFILLIFSKTFAGELPGAITDSLEKELTAAKTDRQKLRTLYNIASWHLSYYSPDSKKWVAEFSSFKKKIKADTAKSLVLLLRGNEEMEFGNPEKAVVVLDSALAELKKNNQKFFVGGCLNSLGSIYVSLGNYPESIERFREARNYIDTIAQTKLLCENYLGTGNAFNQFGDKTKALEWLQKALALARENKFYRTEIQANMFIGSVYDEGPNKDNAFRYFSDGTQKAEKLGDKRLIAASKTYLGNFYYSQKNYNEALRIYKEVEKLTFEEKLMNNYAGMLGNIGNIYADIGQTDSAFIYQYRALKIFKQTSDIQGLAICQTTLGDMHMEKNRLDSAEYFYLESQKLAEQMHSLLDYIQNYEGLSMLYEKRGDYKQAFHYARLHKQYSDSIFNEENTRKLTEMEMNFQFREKQKEQELVQKNKDDLAQEQLKRQKLINFAAIAGIVALLIIVVIVFRSSALRKKANLALKEKNTIIEEKNKGIMDSINYAKRIQQSLLPTEKYIDKSLKRLQKK